MLSSQGPGSGLREYADAEQYDLDNTWAADDEFYLELAREIGGPVLDVGCGTGRLTRALAAAGLEVTGVDVTPEMLERAENLDEQRAVTWVRADARTMQLAQQFRLIISTSHAFQHLLTDQDIRDFLERAREHLLPGGYLAFETRNYVAKTWGHSREPVYVRSFQNPQGRWIDEELGAEYDPESGVERVTFVEIDRETGERSINTTSLRYLPVDHLNDLLIEHGFTVLNQYGDWTRGPLSPDQPEVVTVAQLSQ